MLKRLDWYIIRKYLGTYIFSIILIISISVVFDVTEKLDHFIDKQAPLHAIIFEYYLNFIPYFTNLFTPLFSFISVIFFTSKMAYNSEIIAILAGGISFNRMLRPYIISAVIIGLFSFILGSYVIPPANKTRLEFQNKYVRSFTSDIARDVQLEVDKGVIMYIERYEENMQRGTHFSMEKFDGKKLVSRLTASTIEWDSAYNWRVKNYLIRDFNGIYETISKGDVLDTTINIMPSDFFIVAKHAPQMNNFELRRYLRKQHDRGLGNIQAFEDEYYKRYSMPFSALILMLIGVSLSSRKVRGGMGLHIGAGIALSALYILFQTLSSTFAVQGSMPTLLAVWLPNILFLIVGIILYIRAPK